MYDVQLLVLVNFCMKYSEILSCVVCDIRIFIIDLIMCKLNL